MSEKVAAPYINFHSHTEFSALDGTVRIPDYVRWGIDHRLPVIPVTDHGIMAGAVALEQATSKKDIIPVYGCELYSRSLLNNTDNSNYHLLALARNRTGYKNLVKLLSESHKPENFYYKPRVNLELIKRYSEGIIFSTACAAGELSRLVALEDYERAEKFLDLLKSATEEMYCEMVDGGPLSVIGERNGQPLPQDTINADIYRLAHRKGLPVIITTDSHYFKEDLSWYKPIIAAQRKKTLAEFEGAMEAGEEYNLDIIDMSVRDPEEMAKKWNPVYPDAIENTLRIAGKIERYNIAPDTYVMPMLPVKTDLKDLAVKGLEKKIANKVNKAQYRNRLDYELGVITSMGYGDYFLMVWELVQWAKSQGIPVGPGRGSAAGSLLAYCLGITNIDPLQYNLLFERFLNPDRVSMPDIDVDFSDRDRDRILDHLREVYTDKGVAGIINYSYPKYKQAFRDAARVLGYGTGPGQPGDQFVRALSDWIAAADDPANEIHPDTVTPEEIIKDVEPSKAGNIKREDMLAIVDLGLKMRRVIRHYGTHASGIVIAPPDVTDYAPIFNLGGNLVTDANMSGVEYNKLIKMDILGLSLMSILQRTVEIGLKFDPNIPTLDDLYDFLNVHGAGRLDVGAEGKITADGVKRAEMLLKEGNTTGVFQLSGNGMRSQLSKLHPKNIEELSALLAGFRPGPIQSGILQSYTDSVMGRKIENPFPEAVQPIVGKIAADTRGCPLYQEHIMRIAQEVGGYTLAQADLMRRAMGKKKVEIMEKEKHNFVSGAMNKGFTKEDAEKTFDVLEYFAGYGFNKSHSTAYAYLAYICAYYKANYMPAFMSAFLESKNRSEKKEDFAPLLMEVSKDFAISPPRFSFKDEVMEDLIGIGIVRQVPVKGISAQEAWKTREAWKLRMGIESISGVTEKTVTEKLGSWTCPDTMKEFMLRLVLTEDKPPVNALAALVSDGVFDPMLKNDITEKIPPAFFRAYCFGLNNVTAEEIPREIKDAIELMAGDFVRDNKSSDRPSHVVRMACREQEGKEKDRLSSLIGYTADKLRSRLELKNPWSRDQIETYLDEKFIPGLRAIASSADRDLSEKFWRSPAFRVKTFQAIHSHEKKRFGVGITVTDLQLAAEMTGYSFAGYADEDRAFRSVLKYRRNESLCMIEEEGGLWFLGIPHHIFWKDGEARLMLAGRYGTAGGSMYLKISNERAAELKDHLEKAVCAVKVMLTEKNDWEIKDDIRIINIGRPVEPDYAPEILPSVTPMIRFSVNYGGGESKYLSYMRRVQKGKNAKMMKCSQNLSMNPVMRWGNLHDGCGEEELENLRSEFSSDENERGRQ